MANSGVTGRVVDDSGAGIADLIVGAYDIGLFGERLLVNTSNSADAVSALRPYARTGANGAFSITFAPGSHDLVVRVFDTVLRLVGVGTIRHDVTDTVLALPDDELQTSRELATGYVAKGGDFSQAVDGNALTPLIDNHDAWSEVVAAVDAAQTSIDWMLFYLDIGLTMMTFAPDAAVPGRVVAGRYLEDALRAAAGRGVKIRLACNQLTTATPQIDIGWPVTTAAMVAKTLSAVANITVRPIRTHFTAPIHTKFVVIDDSKAWVLGSPFVSDYYDDVTHSVSDARHGSFPRSPLDSRGIRAPVHDVSLRVNGPVVAQLSETFLTHWTGVANTPPPAAPASAGQVRLQVVRSLAGNSRWTGLATGEATIVESYLRAINLATTYVYLENQYFTEPVIADALILRLKQVPDLEVIFLTNNKVDIPDYQKWQPQTMLRVLEGLSPGERKRVGFYSTWSHAPGPKPSGALVRNYIHSKVAIIDDSWATVGSANLDGDSLTHSQNAEAGKVWAVGFILPSLVRFPGDISQDRESETNLSVFDGVDGAPRTGFAPGLRKALWAEHLGYLNAGMRPDATAADLQTRPAGGWLSLWDAKAAAKLTGLKASPATISPAKVLRFPFTDTSLTWPSKADTAAGYLKWAGVDVKQFGVWEVFRRFDWSAGTWLDAEI